MVFIRRWGGIILAIVLCASPVSVAHAQIWGVQGGLNLATFGGDDAGGTDNLTAWQVGGAALLGAGRAGLLTGLVLTRKGAVESFGAASGRFLLTYLQVPLLARLVLSDAGSNGSIGTHFYLGPALALKTGCSVELTFQGTSESADCEEAEEGEDPTVFASTEVAAIAGFGVDIEKFSMSLQYDLGLSDIVEGLSLRNRTLSVMVRYFWR